MEYRKICPRCDGEGRMKVPKYDKNNPVPATWEEPEACGVCGGEGWLKTSKQAYDRWMRAHYGP